MARVDDPDKRWKISEEDFNERKFWDDYQTAYEAALTKCSTPEAPSITGGSCIGSVCRA